MALVLEDGSGVSGANSYTLASFVTAYLAERNRASEGGWTTPETSAEDAACVAATDYIEKRYRLRFKGQKEHRDISVAKSTLTFAQQPTATQTVDIGSQTYTFVSALTVAGDVLIGASTSASLDNLRGAVNADTTTAGTSYHASTVVNDSATATTFIGDTLVAKAKTSGTAANTVATTTTVTNASWSSATLAGGADIVTPQPLSFPRAHLFDRDGIAVVGIPDRLKFACAEYAVRARAATLDPDPTVDASLAPVIRTSVKVGPIEDETEFAEGAVPAVHKSYPAADELLAEYLKPRGTMR